MKQQTAWVGSDGRRQAMGRVRGVATAKDESGRGLREGGDELCPVVGMRLCAWIQLGLAPAAAGRAPAFNPDPCGGQPVNTIT